ncbi:MAG: hypothetical protein A2046_09790 [Bacteroidetes bacterium GWA2_30_7]|nr:MAG: hypothetical protein A2046_09790 [Bacteroidetes bacterium GWA2_30_7]
MRKILKLLKNTCFNNVKFRIFSIVLLFLTLFFNNKVFSQNDSLFKNRINIEMGGVAAHYSVNIEKRLFNKTKNYLTVILGFSPSLAINSPEIYSKLSPRVYLQIKDNIKFKKNYLEFGASSTVYYWINKPFSIKTQRLHLALFPIIGYSRDISKKINLGFYFTPIVYDVKPDFILWGAIKLGYNLN